MIWGPWCWRGDWQGCTLGDGTAVSLGGMMLGFIPCTLGGCVVSTVLILSGILIVKVQELRTKPKPMELVVDD
eukprot:5542619-Ditylum_brightwellii.AAC.1